MQLRIGNYFFASGSVQVGLRQQAVMSAMDVPYMYDVDVSVKGRLYASGQTALSQAENLLRAQLLIQGQDIVLYQDNGQPSSVTFLASQTIGGPQVVSGPNFESTYGADFATFREFTFGFKVRIPVVNVLTVLTEFEEDVEYSGGTPEYVFKRAINGPPQKQLAWLLTEYRVVQSGRAVGFRGYPTPPGPLARGALKTAPRVRRRSPQRKGGSYLNYAVSWTYEMEAPVPINVLPNIWR